MLDELDHPDDVPMPAPSTPPVIPPLFAPQTELDDTSEIPVIRETDFEAEYTGFRQDGWKKKKKKKDKKRNKDKARRDFTLPPDDPHGPDRVTQNA